MAYFKLKELTKYFNFSQEVALDNLPGYATEYLTAGEKILASYHNFVDYILFTDRRLILFDKKPFLELKRIHNIPYSSISSSAIDFAPGKAKLFFSMDSGYQLRIDFNKMNHYKKERLKGLYKSLVEKSLNKK